MRSAWDRSEAGVRQEWERGEDHVKLVSLESIRGRYAVNSGSTKTLDLDLGWFCESRVYSGVNPGWSWGNFRLNVESIGGGQHFHNDVSLLRFIQKESAFQIKKVESSAYFWILALLEPILQKKLVREIGKSAHSENSTSERGKFKLYVASQKSKIHIVSWKLWNNQFLRPG